MTDNAAVTALITLATYLSLVSAAAERCTEIIKKFTGLEDRLKAKYRVPTYQLLSAVVCGVMAYMQPPVLNIAGLQHLDPFALAVILAFAGSGGSALWHDILGMLNSYKSSMPSKPVIIELPNERKKD